MIKNLLYFCTLLFLFASCEEVPIQINPIMGPMEPMDTIDIGDQDRQVLIEEFTGVRCVQCPAGSVEIEDLLTIHGVQLIAVSIHAGEFSPPHPDSDIDFTTTEGDQIINYLGNPIGYPSAVVNRKLFDGEFDLQLGKSLWAGYIGSEKLLPPKVRIGLLSEYNNDDRSLDLEVLILVDEMVDETDVRLSVMITESGLVDRQTTPGGEDYEYVHKHALRGMMSTWDGNPLNGPLVTGEQIEETLSMTIPNDWDPANCSVIAFVHLAGENKEVLQAVEVKMTE